MKKIVDKISEKTLNFIFDYMSKSVKTYKKRDLWVRAVKKACEATEGMDDSFADYILKSLAVQRHYAWLISNKSLDDVYRSFILTIAVELCAFNTEKTHAVSFGMAILDNWFESNGKDYQNISNQIAGDEIANIINNREKLYREYFLMYNDSLAKDTIRVYYPKNGENWIRWDKNYSVDIKVNLSKGTEYGFCRIGFSYSRIDELGCEKFLRVAYLNEDREIYRFEHDHLPNVNDQKILWVW